MYLAMRCQGLFSKIRSGEMRALSEQEFQKLISEFFNQSVEAFERVRIHSEPLTEEAWEKEGRGFSALHDEYKTLLARRDYSKMDGMTEWMMTQVGIEQNEIDHESFDFKKLRREALKAFVHFLDLEVKRHRGVLPDDMDYLKISSRVVPSIPSLSMAPLVEEPSIPISVLFDEFRRERLAGNKWREKTRGANESVAATMIEILGDRQVSTMDKATGRKYKAALQKYPINRHKDKRFKNKTLTQIHGLKDVEPIATQTINNHLNKAAALFGWGVNQGYLEVNPFDGLRISMEVRVKDQVLPFDRDDLEKIFNAPLYREHKYNRPHQFWLPLIGLYSGARLEEICQLHVGDIKEVDGVWVFDICEDVERKLKTRSSERVVPIHPFLIEVGFLKYVDRMQKQNRKKLFPELNRHNGKISHGASQWFGKFKRGLGFPERKKVFHSFRHSVISMLRKKRVPDHEVKMLLGHVTGSITHDRYGGDEPVALLEVIKELNFEIDLSHLKFKK